MAGCDLYVTKGNAGVEGSHDERRAELPERALQRECRDRVQAAARLAGGGRSHSGRSWENLGMTEIPLAPPWTDHNTSDPGITVLEVLAYSVAALVGLALASVWWRCCRRTRESSHASTGG